MHSKYFPLLVFLLVLAAIAGLGFVAFKAAEKMDWQATSARPGMVQTGDESLARLEQGCPASVRKTCKNVHNDMCEAVYVSGNPADACRRIDAEKIARICGKPDAFLFNSDKACLNLESECPVDINHLGQDNVEAIAQCPALHAGLCAEICGPRYQDTDIRNAFQTKGKPALICIDNSDAALKDGFALAADKQRQLCLGLEMGTGAGTGQNARGQNPEQDGVEIHAAAGGTRHWCVTYNKTFNTAALGAYVQCMGKLSFPASAQ